MSLESQFSELKEFTAKEQNRYNTFMNKNIIIVVVICLIIGVAVGYYFGYDIGWERAIDYSKK